MTNKKILFITTSNLAANPRLVKEIELARYMNFKISVIQFIFQGWSCELTKNLMSKHSYVDFINISADRSPFYPWFLSSMFNLLLRVIPKGFLNLKLLSYRVSKRSILLNYKLKKLTNEFNFVIAHTPGAFHSAYNFASKHGIKFGLDIEDYHPGETNNDNESLIMRRYMSEILPYASYCSFAAPLIEQEVQKDLNFTLKNTITILNGFNLNEFEYRENNSEKLKLVWYSQNIDFGRGLETFLDVLNSFSDKIELNLIGELKSEFANKFKINEKQYITHLNPLTQVDLHYLLSKYDVGLALDFPSNRNRELALTNKIISYVQAGLFLLALETEAQLKFINDYDLNGLIARNEFDSIFKAIEKLIHLKKVNKLYRQQQYEIGKSFAWQNISKPLEENWSQYL